MGTVHYRRIEFAATMSELAGYKAGFALTQRQIIEHVPDFEDLLIGNDDDLLRIRAEEVEELLGNLLYALGSARSPGITFPGISLFHRFKSNAKWLTLYQQVNDLFIEWANNHKEGPFPLMDFVEIAKDHYGGEAGAMALLFVEEIKQSFHKNPWNNYRRIEWHDTTELNNLFESEKLGSSHGRFFDQRFIDYIAANFDSIDKINWRQFEGLAGEYFDRTGFRVEVGPGRDDDGIDLRVWRSDDPADSPPAMVVQCKRQKDKVGKVVVKALWADVASENAESGLIVTTSVLSPGARKVCTARAYPIQEANRKTVKLWIDSLRTPSTGVFMGE